MDSREVGDLLEECLRALTATAQPSFQPSEAERLNYCSCRDSLCAELASLLQEAVEMKWPFVPEKWQYKQSVRANDKSNLSDVISKHLSQLLGLLKASIVAQEAGLALAVVFLVDRFLYWMDESSRLLKITMLLHRHYPDTPLAPQLVIRQARVYLNSGKLQKAEYILSSLINNSGATGCWVYQAESDRALVQAVSVQVAGIILQKLGLWLESAELIWASLVGYYALPQPDKKGIGTSLGLLANILMSMNDVDFCTFRTNPENDLTLLGDRSHRLVTAAQVAKMAVVYSQYTPLYVLTNVVTQGTCLLSYSFSVECPTSERQSFLMQAKEAFTIGLLTKAEGEPVTSKQELHTFLKGVYSLIVTHKWLGAPQHVVAQATRACRKALANFCNYGVATQDKDSLCAEIMHLVTQVKLLLQVEPFLNSDKESFIPDSYRDIKDVSTHFTLEDFATVMQRFQKYHASQCETTDAKCRGTTKDEIDGTRVCITALGTTIGTLNTECPTEAGKLSKQSGWNSSAKKPDLCTTVGSTDNLGSSWQNLSLSSSGSPHPSSSYTGGIAIVHEEISQSCLTTEADDNRSDSMLQSANRNQKRYQGHNSAITATSSFSSRSEKFKVMQARIETLGTEEDGMNVAVGEPLKPSAAEGAGESMSLRTSSSSLSDSFSSQSSWEKISADSTNRVPQPHGLSTAGTKSQESDGSFCFLETLDSETNPTHRKHTTGEVRISSISAAKFDPEQSTSTEPSTQSSFEMLEDNQSGHQSTKVSSAETTNVPKRKNILCYSCINHSTVASVDSETQYLLSLQDYQALLAGVCHECLLKRLHSDEIQFKLKKHSTTYSALLLKFSKVTGLWTARETCVYIGEPMGLQGRQRTAIWVIFLHQEERLSSYVGKDYLKPKEIQFHLKDVERQMTAQFYVTEFNKSLYHREVMAQIFFIPSEALMILDGDEIVGCVTVEPYMHGDFVKLTNNKEKKDNRFQATEYGIAFGHFTYLFSDCQEVVVDLQGWVTASGKGLTYLTDPQIHSIKTPEGLSNFAARGLNYFLEEQHGPDCNDICHLLELPAVIR